MLKTALHYSRQLLTDILQPGDIAVDATMGNGNDTLLLAELVGKTGFVYAFDIQAQAIEKTKERLYGTPWEQRVQLVFDGHENLDFYLPTDLLVKAAVFNLGYLPQSDKAIITLPQTTKKALDALLLRLAPRGRIVIVAYYGHEGGTQELTHIRQYCEQLPQDTYNVLNYQFINQKNQPPILFCIEKKPESRK
ncbi:tRNA (mnm(5)s(2)U34)-methyltransferase [Enterococcus sp. LJL98]